MNAQERERPGTTALKWWSELTHPQRGDRGALGQLRRCKSAVDALTIVQAVDLARKLGHRRLEDYGFLDALGLAVLLAHVKEDDPGRMVMRAAGWSRFPGTKKEGSASEGRPVLSELRFRRLLRTTPEERISAFARLVRILGGKVNVADLAESFLLWGEKMRQKWAFSYFAIGVSAPSPSDIGADQ